MLWLVLLSIIVVVVVWVFTRKPLFVDEQGLVNIRGKLPWIGAGLQFVTNPKNFMETLVAKHGENFVVWMWGAKFYFVFSPEGMRSLYQVEEDIASFHKATNNLLSLKVPPEITGLFDIVEPIWSKIFLNAFKRELMGHYLSSARNTVREIVDGLPGSGKFEVATFFRKFIHKYAFRCWCGEDAADKYLERFKDNFDKIDPEVAFVNPIKLIWTILTQKKKEREAVAQIFNVMTEIQHEKISKKSTNQDLFTILTEILPGLLPHLPLEETKKIATYLVIALHLASQTNLSSAISWLFVNLVKYPDHRIRALEEGEMVRKDCPENWWTSVETLNQMDYMEKIIYETIRLTQQSITLRVVRQPLSVQQGNKEFSIAPGNYLATLLNVKNCCPPAVPDTDFPAKEFHPERFEKGKVIGCPVSHSFVMSTFGHAKHACPGRIFSIHTFKIVMTELFELMDFDGNIGEVQIPHTQMGAVARLDRPVWVNYKKKY